MSTLHEQRGVSDEHSATTHGTQDLTDTNSNEPTPLPRFQLFIVLLIQFSEPITALVIYPFINQLVRETGITNGDERKTGYYAGIIGPIRFQESAFFFAECATVVQWGYFSDRYGRRPVLLLGPLGLAVSMLMFGQTTTFWPLVGFRCLQGIFNGNIGVSRSVIAEITDSSNIGDAFAFVPLMWSVGTTTAPIIGGILSSPATRWPDTLGRIDYLRTHPYFLPCAAAAFLAFMTFAIASLGLKETLPSIVARENSEKYRARSLAESATLQPTAESTLIEHGGGPSYGTGTPPTLPSSNITSETSSLAESKSPRLRSLLTGSFLMTFLCIAILAFLDMSHSALLPLFYSTSIPLGGLGLDPFQIGVTLGTFGCINSIFQLNVLGRVIRKFGARKVFINSFCSLLGSFLMYPIMSFLAQRAGRVDGFVIMCMIIQLCCQSMIYLAYGSIQVVLVEGVPTGGAMGTVNGIAQMLSSGMRSIAPTFASSLFSISLQRHIAGGNMVFYVLMGMTLVGIRVSRLLPIQSKERGRPSRLAT
ncbi:major facilitator superfamily multidrug-resistance, DHA1 sub-family [Crassisporium funariophilum]|nr:major facilitator superfamily multidrug-resistance, DHA1 sub-family [Crassisporium funariophilum]